VSSLAVAGGRVVQSMGRAGDLGPWAVRLGDRPGPGVVGIVALAGLAYVSAGLSSILGLAGWMLAGSSALVVGAGVARGVFEAAGERVVAVGFVGGTAAVLAGSAVHAPGEAATAAGTFVVAAALHALVGRGSSTRSHRPGA